MHRASLARAYLEAKYKNLNEESQDREESLRRIQILNARMDQMGIAESERDKYRQQVWQEVREGCFVVSRAQPVIPRMVARDIVVGLNDGCHVLAHDEFFFTPITNESCGSRHKLSAV